jgi:hypothetical protein
MSTPMHPSGTRVDISGWRKLQIISVAAFSIWVLVSMWANIITDISMVSHPPPRPFIIQRSLGFPSTRVLTGAKGSRFDTGGNIGKGPQALDPPSRDLGVDVSVVCNEGEKCVCLLNKTVPIPMIVCTLVGLGIFCYLLAVVVGAIWNWICGWAWVQQAVSYTQCETRDCAWWDVWCWANRIFCYVVTTIQWVLQWICQWVQVLVWGTAIACVIVGIVVIIMLS